MKPCEKCPIRKFNAKAFDQHFDEKDCPYLSAGLCICNEEGGEK